MADQSIGLAADGPGKKVHAFENTITIGGSATVVEDQAVCLVDQFGVPLNGTAAPATSARGLIVRSPMEAQLPAALATALPASGASGLVVREAAQGQQTAANSRPVVLASDQLPAGAALADGTANPTATLIEALSGLFNGTTWDRARGNVNTTTGDIGTKTAPFNGAMQTNYNARGAYFVFYVNAVSGTTPVLSIQTQFSLDGGGVWFNFGPALPNITATNQYAFLAIYPTNTSVAGATPSAVTAGGTVVSTTLINAALPRNYRFVYTITGTTPSFALGNVAVCYIL